MNESMKGKLSKHCNGIGIRGRRNAMTVSKVAWMYIVQVERT